ncbi:MAG: hypothetical protein DRH17_11165 [Deltaproteobacteria bacterium]|nr:MAG: hypothetical protein DRH17_11165 [Deltaproteobacteria bacterium]
MHFTAIEGLYRPVFRVCQYILFPLLLIMFCLLRASAFGADRWETIRVLDLDTAAAIALEQSPNLAAAAARVEQARHQVAIARASYWPQVNLTGNASRVDLSPNEYHRQLQSARILNPFATVEDPEDYYAAGANATWVLFDGFARKFRNLAARKGLAQSESRRRDASRLLLSAVAAAYFSAQLAKQTRTIAEADEVFNLRLLAVAQSRYKAGAGSLSDVLNFRIRANTARADRLRAEAELKVARIGLAALLGRPDSRLPEGVELAPLSDPAPEQLRAPSSKTLACLALETRPDVKALQEAVEQAVAQVKVTRSKFFPTVQLAANLEGQRSGNADMERDDFGSTISLTLSYPLFAGGAHRAELKKAKAALEEVVRTFEQAKINVRSEVNQAVANLISAQQQLALARENARLVRRQRDLVEKGYRAGQLSLVRLNEAQKDLVAVEGQLAQALATVHRRWYDLLAATGQILWRFSAATRP